MTRRRIELEDRYQEFCREKVRVHLRGLDAAARQISILTTLVVRMFSYSVAEPS